MLDIQIIRDNPDKVKKATSDKGFDASVVDKAISLDLEYRKVLRELEETRHRQNEITELVKQGDKSKLSNAAELKETVKKLEPELKNIEEKLANELYKIPNISASDVHIGPPEENEVIKTVGEIPKFDYKVRDHVEIGQLTDTIDIERGSKVTQSGFYYLKGDGALLEMALINFALQKLAERGFTPVITPNLAKERNVVGCGFQSRSDKERQIYNIEGEDLDLIATAEITLVGLHTDEILKEEELPKQYAGFSSCYRREIGSYGKDVRGILRVHEFRKVEMVIFCKPEESDTWHEKLLAIEEEVWKELGVPYQVVKMATGDLGNAASRKYDIEAWMPSQEKYREVTSTSNTTDFQTRRLNIKYKKEGKNEYLHSLNGTVLALGRAMIAIYENFQNEDGSVNVPEVLQKYLRKKKIEVV